MKHVNTFTAFLRDTVNINQTRLDQLDEHVEAIYAALEDDDKLGELVLDKLPQGSWPHRTIIKPLKDHEFDADFLLVLDENPEWSEHPSEYINAVYAALRRHSTYGTSHRAQVPVRAHRLRQRLPTSTSSRTSGSPAVAR